MKFICEFPGGTLQVFRRLCGFSVRWGLGYGSGVVEVVPGRD